MTVIVADGSSETLEDLHIEVDIRDDNDIKGLCLKLEV